MIKKRNLREVEFVAAPNRRIAELISRHALGSAAVTLRLLEMVPASRQLPRHPHAHNDFEEAILVLEGSGGIWVEEDFIEIEREDVLLIPPGTMHVIFNTGEAPLRLACFFPTNKGVDNRTCLERWIDPPAPR